MSTRSPLIPVGPPIGIVGLGLIGGSLAKGLVQAGWRVHGWDTDSRTRARALEDGIVLRAGIRAIAESCPVVFVAIPLFVYREVAEEIAALELGDRSVVFVDVGSTRRPFAELAGLGANTPGVRFLGTHPMAGSEHQGYEYARHDLFLGSTWILLIEGNTRFEDFVFVGGLALALGAYLLTTDPSSHDDAVARISHLSHVLAAVLSRLAVSGTNRSLPLSIAAGSFRDGTRVMTSSPAFATDLCIFNRDALLLVLREACRDIEVCLRALEQEERTELEQFFASAHVVRQAFLSLASEERTLEDSIGEREDWRHRLLERGSRGERIIGMEREGAETRFKIRLIA